VSVEDSPRLERGTVVVKGFVDAPGQFVADSLCSGSTELILGFFATIGEPLLSHCFSKARASENTHRCHSCGVARVEPFRCQSCLRHP
jgi:hypothetical protein